ncbi:Inosose dehydratase [Rhodobacteraceae bacterium THAF1]|uniref:myo-inosose-2 dehydratase n=1 Tax=Palleronia sp. THAF1 TaxID=2587842 RepID=UPI000F401499|nr:myo-inosose-2 dehydratase [Palleronia sp. THAF1]QFU07552.1 Inosose dehydratase [Palleronia sp. THAF1]VDC22895.1 Inosose dehydratase [Rhodobacteraceae bacterium THAF1]
MSVKIGISPVAWQNDDLPELTNAFTMDDALRDSAEIGYTGIERGRRMPADTDGLRAYLNRYGLSLCGGWCSGSLLANDVQTEIEQIRAQVEQFAALGSPCIVYAECSNTVQGSRLTPVSKRPKLSREDVVAYGAKLGEVAKWSADQGLPMVYHHHMGAIVEDADDIDWLMEGAPEALQLLYDTGHLDMAGGDTMAVLRKWSGRIGHVHYKDVRADVVAANRKNDGSFLDAVVAGAFTVPGDPEGSIDFAAVTDELARIGYDGWIVVEAEQDPAKVAPFEASKRGYEHILSCCDASGLTIEGRG